MLTKALRVSRGDKHAPTLSDMAVGNAVVENEQLALVRLRGPCEQLIVSTHRDKINESLGLSTDDWFSQRTSEFSRIGMCCETQMSDVKLCALCCVP